MSKKSSNIPKVHKKVKKKDMLFEYILIAILAVFFIYLLLYIFDVWPTITTKVAPVAGAVVALYALIWQLHSAIRANKVLASIDIDIAVDAEMVTISCLISNIGTKSIYPYLTNLYISEGIEKNENGVIRYDFEGITEHQVGGLRPVAGLTTSSSPSQPMTISRRKKSTPSVWNLPSGSSRTSRWWSPHTLTPTICTTISW